MPADEELAERLAARLRADPRGRAQRLAKIKQAVESCDYENSLKLSVALDRLLDNLNPSK